MENFVFCAVFYSKCAISVTVYAYLFPALLFLKSTWHVMCHALLEKQIKEQFLQKFFSLSNKISPILVRRAQPTTNDKPFLKRLLALRPKTATKSKNRKKLD